MRHIQTTRANVEPIISRNAACAALAAVLILAATSVGSDEALLSKMPAHANAIVLVDPPRILTSPLAVRQGWTARLTDAFASTPLAVPPDAQRMAVAAWIEPTTMQPLWQVAIMQLAAGASVEAIARDEDTTLEEIAGRPATAVMNAYFIELDPTTLAVVVPANRQFAARWLRGIDTSDPQLLSDYLREAAAGNADAAWVIAIDLQDAISPARVRQRLESDPPAALRDADIDAEELAEVLAAVKGLTMRVDFDEQATGRCTIDFASDAEPLTDVGKPLLLEVLGEMGAGIADIQGWDAAVERQTLVLHGPLGPAAMGRVFSVLDAPAPRHHHAMHADAQPAGAREPAEDPEPPVDPRAQATRQYYQAVSEILDHVQKHAATSPASLQQGAAWLSRDATRISRLPATNVDPDMIAWAGQTASRLREAANAFAVGQQQAQARSAGIQMHHHGAQDAAAAEAHRRQVAGQRRQVAAEERARATEQANRILQEIDATRGQIRAQMAERYDVAF